METILSKDGARITYEKVGYGKPVVLVHGTGTDHSRWKSVIPFLENTYALYIMDRRGRGMSSDPQPYSIEREYEDVAVLVDSIPHPASLLGHSYGGLVATEAALRTKNLKRLILYEPAFMIGGYDFPPEIVADIEARLRSWDREGAVEVFLREIAMVSPDEIKQLRMLPTWKERLASAHTLLRELKEPGKYHWEPQRIRQIQVPTLLLLGEASPAYRKKVIDKLHAALPKSHITLLPGQKHIAMASAPEQFANEILTFLAEPVSEAQRS
jgi:pimeloyl-ACP methyl ester carboxylesterase